MLSVEEAFDRIVSTFNQLEAEDKPILDSLGQVLDVDVYSRFDIPPLDNSAMDGYAVRHKDLKGASADNPVVLEVVGVVSAGEIPTNRVEQGTTIRIMTGAAIPDGCDAVVPFEDTDETERKDAGLDMDEVGVMVEQPRGKHIRPAGEDVMKGQKVLKKGSVIRPAEVGVLASLGLEQVRVIRRPTVAILATGNELLSPGQDIDEGKIYDSNSYSLYTSVLKYGGIPRLLGIAKDNLQDMNKMLDRGLDADLLLTSAGVSKGDYDMVKDVLTNRGEVKFWSVRMRPAKPLAWGMIRGSKKNKNVPHLGLPGNPVSAIVAFEEFVRPAILKMLGKTQLIKPTIEARLMGSIINFDGRRVFARVHVIHDDGTYYAYPLKSQGSNILTSMVAANGLAICSENEARMDKGRLVRVKMLDWNEEVVI